MSLIKHKPRYKLIKYKDVPESVRWDFIRAYMVFNKNPSAAFRYEGIVYIWRRAHDTWYKQLWQSFTT
jgi:hypothetical protein